MAMRKYYLCYIYEIMEDHSHKFIRTVRFEKNEKKEAIEIMRFVRSLGNYYAMVWPRVEELKGDV